LLKYGFERARLQGLLKKLVALKGHDFTSYGGISESFYANEFVAAAPLTRKAELFFNIWWDQFKFDTIPARSLEADIDDLRLKTGLYLTEDHRRISTARLFRLYKTLISSLHLEYYRWADVNNGRRPAVSARFVADLSQIRKELEIIRDTYMRIGPARGTAAIAAMGGIAAVLLGKAAYGYGRVQ
jgi:hypothetical protein